MSGIVGIVNCDGAPVDHGLLRRMTASLTFRGPDAQNTWASGSAGLGHTLLRTTDGQREHQPATLDGRTWITADARIDGRSELVSRLVSRGQRVARDATDVGLILAAYAAWGDECVDYLLGDFVFALWDAPRRRLFCARDHFGVKPFFYAHVAGSLVFSNTLDCVRLHPDVSRDLNEQAVADFLLFGSNQEPSSSAFADIQRLPAAHVLDWSPDGLRVRRYWTLPIDGSGSCCRPRDALDRFQELLRLAVEDRLTTDRVGIDLSGGLDSSSIAVVAQEVASAQSRRVRFRAHTVVYDRLMPDRERYYAGLVARQLDIPIDYFVADDYLLFEHERGATVPPPPEPAPTCLWTMIADSWRRSAEYARVSLTGHGGDAMLCGGPRQYCAGLLKAGRVGQLLTALWYYVKSGAPLSSVIPREMKHLLRAPASSWLPSYPAWLQCDFAARLGLQERWRDFNATKASRHPLRPDAYESLSSVEWPAIFEKYDPAWTFQANEARHPLFDRRLIEFALTVPPVPWCISKALLRAAMQNKLPEGVRRRPKSPLAADPVEARLSLPRSQNPFVFEPGVRLREYVDVAKLHEIARAPAAGGGDVWMDLRPRDLAFWLRTSVEVASPGKGENHANGS